MKQKQIITAISTIFLFILILISCNKSTKIVPVDNIILNQTEITLNPTQEFQLTAILSPDNATNKTVIYQTSDENIALVSPEGLIIAQNYGIAIITAIVENGKINATCEIKVTPEPIAVTAISLNLTTLAIEVGKTETLIATIEPENATNKNIIWNSSDESIATVSEEGVVTAISEGTAIISATSEDALYEASCDVLVYVMNTFTFTVTNTEQWTDVVVFIRENGNYNIYTIYIEESIRGYPGFYFPDLQNIQATIIGNKEKNPIINGSIIVHSHQNVTIQDIIIEPYQIPHNCVRVTGENAILNMKGNTIIRYSCNSGVIVEDYGTFIMHDGIISDNYTDGWGGGGVILFLRGTFIMHGGLITRNASTAQNGHVSTGGGGVLIWGSSTFIMTGGTISHNTSVTSGGGIEMWAGTFLMSGGTISNNEPGGVISRGATTIIMSGGIIYGTKSSGTPEEYANIGYPMSKWGWNQNITTTQYGDGTNIFPHIDGKPNYTIYTIIGRE